MLGKLGATVIGSTVLILGAATQAVAAGPSYIDGPAGGAYLRNCDYPSATTSCPTNPIQPWLPNRTYVTMVCWKDAAWATGAYSSNRWFTVDTDIVTGWVHSSLVQGQISVPPCP
jgi:hypothetical protein